MKHLDNIMNTSILKQSERGVRRYFPIEGKHRKGWKYLSQAFFIIFGHYPKDKGEIGKAIMFSSLDKYVERFDGKLWVRTVYRVK